MMSFLKRALPFILTLLVGFALGGGLKRASNDGGAPAATTATQSCKMRKRQAMLAPPPPPPLPSFEKDLFTARDVTRKPHVLHKPEPLYTNEARLNNVTGTVRLRVVLAADGQVRDIVPLNTLPDGLTEEAIEAARAIRFEPATKDGRAVSQYVTVEYNFNLD